MANKPNLPCLPVHIDKMTQRELQSHVGRMVRCVSGRGPGYGNVDRKPNWWPSTVPWCSPREKNGAQWSHLLRKAVKNCYKYYDMAEMLSGSPQKSSNGGKRGRKSSRSSSHERNSISGISLQNVTSESDGDLAKACEAPVPVSGPIPSKLFASLKERAIPTVTPVYESEVDHTKSRGNASERDTNKVYTNGTPRGLMSFVEIFVCFFCEKEFGSRKALRAHQHCCSMKPPHLEKVDTPVLSRLGYIRPPLLSPVVRPRWCTKPVHPDKHHRAPKSAFVEYLDLIPKYKIDTVKRRRDQEVDCENLDLDDNPIPKSPTTPKSKMTLLRQDLSPPACVTARRSLSRTLSITSPQKGPNKDKEGPDSDAESECSSSVKSESSEDSVKLKRSAATRLLSIPLSSELGHRVRNHIEAKGDVFRKQLTDDEEKDVEKTSNYEKYCHTPRKSEHYSRLRTRTAAEYPITFNKRRDVSDWKCHKYKFTWKEKVEFWKTVKTGMNARARKLQRKMKKCIVKLNRLTKKDFRMWLVDYQQPTVLMKALSTAEIEQWSKKHNVDSYMIPMILDSPQYPKTPEHIADEDLKRLLGLRNEEDIKVPLHERSLSLAQCVSEDVNAEVTQQKAVVYKTLLKAMDRTVGDSALTPPDTPPEQHSPSSSANLEQCDTPKREAKNCPSVRKLLSSPGYRENDTTACEKKKSEQSPSMHGDMPLEIEPITKLEPMVFYAGGKGNKDQPETDRTQATSVKKWHTTGGILVPLVPDKQTSTDNDEKPADDFIVTINGGENGDSSSTDSPSPSHGQGRTRRRRVITVNPVSMSPSPRKKLGSQSSYTSTSSSGSEVSNAENAPKNESSSKRPVERPRKNISSTLNSTSEVFKTENIKADNAVPSKRPVGRARKKVALTANNGASEKFDVEDVKTKKVIPSKRPVGRPKRKIRPTPKLVYMNGADEKAVSKGKTAFARKKFWASKKVPRKVTTYGISRKGPLKKCRKNGHKEKIAHKPISDDDEVILSDRSSLASDSSPKDRCKTDFEVPSIVKSRGVKRKRKENAEQVSSVASKKVKNSSKGKSATKNSDNGRMIMFKCHLCGVELHAEIGDRDFIAEHYQETHDVHNIRLRENINSDGQRTVSVIQDVRKTPPSNANLKRPSFSPRKSPSKRKSNGPKDCKNGQLTEKQQNLKNGQLVKKQQKLTHAKENLKQMKSAKSMAAQRDGHKKVQKVTVHEVT